MRNALAVAIVAVLAASPTGQEPASVSPLDQPVHKFQLPKQLPPCGLESALVRIARETRAPVGMERVPGCEQRAPSAFPPAFAPIDSASADVFDGISVKELFGHLAARAPDYEWAIMDGVAVFRPGAAWADPMNPLTARVPAIRFSEATAYRVVGTILNLQTSGQGPKYPITIDFPGGTVIDALNLIVRTQAAAWYASSNGQRLSVGVMMRPEGPGFGVSAPISGLFARR
jgi:hypothetical protein